MVTTHSSSSSFRQIRICPKIVPIQFSLSLGCSLVKPNNLIYVFRFTFLDHFIAPFAPLTFNFRFLHANSVTLDVIENEETFPQCLQLVPCYCLLSLFHLSIGPSSPMNESNACVNIYIYIFTQANTQHL